jgi:hypothetical protein
VIVGFGLLAAGPVAVAGYAVRAVAALTRRSPATGFAA